jgi:para-aminobenzoate synthetase/4-amino-4-deoxychorismate lyase
MVTEIIERDGKLLSPPLARGVLPGVLRAEDLAGGFFVGNSVRGLVSAETAK